MPMLKVFDWQLFGVERTVEGSSAKARVFLTYPFDWICVLICLHLVWYCRYIIMWSMLHNKTAHSSVFNAAALLFYILYTIKQPWNVTNIEFFFINYWAQAGLVWQMQDVWVSYFILSWRVTEWHPLVLRRNLPSCKMLWQLHLSIVGFCSCLCGIIDLSSAKSSTTPLLLLSRQ